MIHQDVKTALRLVQYSKPYWPRILLSAIASLAVGGMDGAIAYLIEPLLKKIFAENNTQVLLILPFGIVLLFSFRGICRYTNDYFIRTAGQLAIQDVRNAFYRRCMELNIRFFHERSTGMLMSRALNDVYMMQEGVANAVTGLFREGFGALLLLGVIFYQNWKLACIAFLVIPLTIWPAQLIGKRIKAVSKRGQETLGELSGILQETFSGVKVIKAFALEQREFEKFVRANAHFYESRRKSFKYEGMSTPVMEVITSLGIAAVVGIGGKMVISGVLTAPQFFSFIGAMAMLLNPLKKLIGTYNNIQQSLGAAERVFEIIDQPSEILDHPAAVSLTRAKGEIEFKEVSFRYDDDYVLKAISLMARQNEVVALVGPSGGGKTTLVSLLSRFYDVSEGSITIDGIDLRSVKLHDLVRQVALVDQETILFNDTIANNIRYGRPNADDEVVIQAARAAFAHEFILELPEGYSTNIGDRGVRLSGGQRQRICIARAILKDAPVLILDEATSALDTESEQMVQAALANLMKNRTTFVIAHRLSTILKADKIIVLDGGEIREQGKHDELLELSGIYRRLYDMQFLESGG